MKNHFFLILFVLAVVSLTACGDAPTSQEPSTKNSDSSNEESKEQVEEKPTILTLEEYNPEALDEDELGIYQSDGTVKIVDSKLTQNEHLNLFLKLPENYHFYEKQKDYEKLEQSRENEAKYGFLINYNDHDRYFIMPNYSTSESDAIGKVGYLSDGETNISIQDLTGTQSAFDLENAQKYAPGFRSLNDLPATQDIYMNEIMLAIGEGKGEIINKETYSYPFLQKISFLAKATNQKNGHTFFVALLQDGDKVYNISIRRESLNVAVDDLSEEWSILDTLNLQEDSPQKGTIEAQISTKDIDPVIKQIRERYNDINSSAESFIVEEMGNGKTTHYYNANHEIQKVIEKSNGGKYEYYFGDVGDVFFVFHVAQDGKENRFYFHEGEMIRWILPDKTIIDQVESSTNKRYSEWESKLLLKSKQYS